MSRQKIEPDNTDRRYFVLTPQIVWAYSRDAYDLAAWSTVKMIAGDGGECYLATETLARLAGMSTGKFSDCRAHLLRVHLLTGELRRDTGYPQPVWHLRIPDLWATNVYWRQHAGDDLTARLAAIEASRKSLHQVKALGKNKGEPSPGEGYPSCGEEGITPGEGKKNVDLELREEEPSAADVNPADALIWQTACSHLRLQLPRSTYETWVKDTYLSARTDHHFVVTTPTTYGADWLNIRLKPLIQRTLAGIVGETCTAEFRADTPQEEERPCVI